MISAPKNDSTVAVKTPGSAINGQVIWKTRLLEEETGLLTNHNGGGGGSSNLKYTRLQREALSSPIESPGEPPSLESMATGSHRMF